MKKALSLLRNFILLLLLSYSFCSCYSSRLVASVETDALVSSKKTHWTFFWGLIEQEQVDAKCPEESISNVTVRDNFLFNAINVASVGIFNPVRFEWNCMPEPTSGDDTIGSIDTNTLNN